MSEGRAGVMMGWVIVYPLASIGAKVSTPIRRVVNCGEIENLPPLLVGAKIKCVHVGFHRESGRLSRLVCQALVANVRKKR